MQTLPLTPACFLLTRVPVRQLFPTLSRLGGLAQQYSGLSEWTDEDPPRGEALKPL